MASFMSDPTSRKARYFCFYLGPTLSIEKATQLVNLARSIVPHGHDDGSGEGGLFGDDLLPPIYRRASIRVWSHRLSGGLPSNV